eukprot:CAMPEP_0171177452 /NCGR_PEP_ID=MMETSP0790-20130122/12246_1 /TAXON_ID=2925 /ORGANISM="Alexandrium catenella, Strain OF101" /LENGTH=190 /DNA_ID=CAMNT_0011642349 /DNA_START=40 /DNA_END=613 /DNA_ORIENTATION=+
MILMVLCGPHFAEETERPFEGQPLSCELPPSRAIPVTEGRVCRDLGELAPARGDVCQAQLQRVHVLHRLEELPHAAPVPDLLLLRELLQLLQHLFDLSVSEHLELGVELVEGVLPLVHLVADVLLHLLDLGPQALVIVNDGLPDELCLSNKPIQRDVHILEEGEIPSSQSRSTDTGIAGEGLRHQEGAAR